MSTHWSCSGQMVKQNRSSNFTYFFLPIGYKLFHELFNYMSFKEIESRAVSARRRFSSSAMDANISSNYSLSASTLLI
jgi:hypothetical protein